jgi:thiamine pyrophosphate-dependent acetolactate synthase large subunit-like protein
MLFISGQQRINSYGNGNRQSSSQEAPILDIVENITKFQGYVDQADLLPEVLDDAYRASMDGRKGPVWVDIVQDVTWADLVSWAVDPIGGHAFVTPEQIAAGWPAIR